MIAEVIVDIASSEVDKIFEYVADETVCPGARVKVPFGRTYAAGFVMSVKEKSEYPQDKLKKIAFVYDEPPAINEESLFLCNAIARRYRCPKALVLRLFLPAEMRTGKVSERFLRFATFVKEVETGRAKKQAACLAYLKEKGKCEAKELEEAFGASALKGLSEKGAVLVQREKTVRSPYASLPEKAEAHVLTPEQERALSSIGKSDRTVQLLHGVTGSGKTEIYLSAIAKVLKEGKSAIFLVPEISLTPQMLAQLRARFSSAVAILHSGLSAGERFDEWWRLRNGEAKIAVGARSAIFAPLEHLGMIVIDEEHDSSYSSEAAPRYRTFDIALMRAKYNGCKLILGSATPSIETYLKAEEGEFNLISLKKRINQHPMPEITIADMREEVKHGNPSPFSSALQEELEKCLKEKKQAILFLNRRGYSQTVICQECGYVAECEACDVPLTYHSEENCLKCHYCGARYKMLSACPNCGGVRIRYGGTGTQRVVSELKKKYPSARILRMDNDTTSGKEGHYRILKEFSERKADILVGTQMIAKGHDFPAVTLVGILDADMSLHFSDYRSGERTFQLVTQVSGRSGRAEEVGKVVLQTYSPKNYILRYAIGYDYKGFFEYEKRLRKATSFPPFSKIVRVMVTGEDEGEVVEALKEVYFPIKQLVDENPEEILFFNKMKAPIKRIQNKFRYQILMRLKGDALIPRIYDACQTKRRNVLVYVEENPNNLS
ncbi:MAG: primosomal protein N' [Clostridia bacterium]|nr:primosomal protein N' [Clostridia bacterium]